jgi:hypothetical protein
MDRTICTALLREDLDCRDCRVSGFWRRGKDLTEAARAGYARLDA